MNRNKPLQRKPFKQRLDVGYFSSFGQAKPRASRHKPVKAQIWQRADRTFSLFIRSRVGWKCELCNEDFSERHELLENSHFYPRRIYAVRYDPRNCMALCHLKCHPYMETRKHSEYLVLMQRRLGSEFKDLTARSLLSVKRNDAANEWLSERRKAA